MRGRDADGMRNRTEHERPAAAAAARNAIKSRKCEKLQSCHNPRDRIIYCFKLDRDADAGRFAEFERGLGLVEALPDLLASRDDYIGILLTLCNRNSRVIPTSE